MNLKTYKITDLKCHPKNYNTHPETQILELSNSLDLFDQVKNIVVWQGKVIAGNGLYLAAQKKKMKTIEVQDVSDWPEEKAIKFMVADNRLSELGIIDTDVLSGLLAEMDDPFETPGIDEAFFESLDCDAGLFDIGHSDEKTNTTGKRINTKKKMTAVMFSENVEIFESALIETKLTNRAEALSLICQFYLDREIS